jgi:hypothetical protein
VETKGRRSLISGMRASLSRGAGIRSLNPSPTTLYAVGVGAEALRIICRWAPQSLLDWMAARVMDNGERTRERYRIGSNASPRRGIRRADCCSDSAGFEARECGDPDWKHLQTLGGGLT